MPGWLITVLSTAGSLVLTLTITLLFNKLVALPKEVKRQREAELAAARAEAEAQAEARREAEEAERLKEEQHAQNDADRDARIAAIETAVDTKIAALATALDTRLSVVEAAVNALPTYRAQSLQIQTQLQATDDKILTALNEIKGGIKENQNILNTRLDRLEDREKNAIRAKLLDEFRLFTDEHKNPMLAWSEMEHHAFFKLVKDYEALHGNDYVHSEVLPAMNRLEVIPMSNKEKLLELMQSRRL